MSAFNTNTFRMIGLLILILTLLAGNARAALPDAGTEIGTSAVVQYEIDGENEEVQSKRVTTTIAQVYATKIEVLGGIAGKAGEDVDIRFAVRNIGNGTDDLTMKMTTAGQINDFVLMPADENGLADESARSTIGMGKPFNRNDVARDQVRHFVARVAVPAGTEGDLQFDINATNKGKTGDTAKVTVKIVDGKAFTVEPGRSAMLKDGKTVVDFKIKGGAEAGTGYFELIVAKKNAPKTPVEFKVVENKIYVNDTTVASNLILKKEKATTFTIAEIAAKINADLKMNIEIDGAKVGDEYVMYVKYADKAESSLIESQVVQIGYAHTMMMPDLMVTGNSTAATADFDVIAAAVSGETVSYAVTLTNKSSRPESFSLALAPEGNTDAIAEMWLVNEKGNKFGTAGDGLPETGLIPVGKPITFTIKVALKHGITAESLKQEIALTVKSLTEPKTEEIAEILEITKVVPVEAPGIKFLDKKSKNSVTELAVAGSDDVANFYLEVATPEQSGTNKREYRISFDSNDTTFQRDGGKAVNAVSSMSAKVGRGTEAGMFEVKTNMRGADKVTVTVTVTDVASGLEASQTIELKKGVSIGFVETGYNAKGAADLDTVVTVNVVNSGSAIAEGKYEIYASKADWDFSFSIDDQAWQEKLALPKMASKATQAIKVKIRVPKKVTAGAIESLQLALRQVDAADDMATVSIALTIGKSKLLINKEIAVLKAGTGSRNYVVKSADKVEDGDVIWYRVVVKNPIDAPVAQNVKIIDLLPKHVQFATGEGEKVKNVKDEVTMIVGEMQPGDEATMEYSVKVKLEK